MDIMEFTKSTFNSDSIFLSERIKVCQLSFSLKRIVFPIFTELHNYITQFSQRDFVKIVITNPDESLLSYTLATSEQEYNDYFVDLHSEDDIFVNIEINKNIVDNRLSIYHYSEFSNDILSNSSQQLIAIFNSLLANLDYLIFDVFDEDVFWCTKTIAFIHDKNILFTPKEARKDRLEKSKTVSYNYSNPCVELLPDDFYITTDYNNNAFTAVFDCLTTILSLSYISSLSIINDNLIKGQINGHKNVPFEYACNSIKTNKELYRIYDWIYTDGNPTDKSIIAHNIISLHCKFTEIIDTDEKTLLSIVSNYQLYLKENANQYLEVKNKVSEYICDIIAKVGSDVTELLSSFKTNLVAVFGFLFTVVLVNIVSEQPLSNIFTKDITAIVEFILMGSFFYFLICLFETVYKYKKNKDAYQELKNNYSDVFSDEEIAQFFDNDRLFNKSKKAVKTGLWIYSIIWCAFVVVAIIIVESISDNPIIFPMISNIFLH